MRSWRSSVRGPAHGFTLVDLSVCIAVVAAGTGLAALGLGESRRLATLESCEARMQALGAGNAQFALTHNGLMAGFTWNQGTASSKYPDLRAQAATSSLNAHAAQAVDILRRGGRPDMPVIQSWIPHIAYSLLPLGDFLGKNLRDPWNVCPDHANQLAWRRWPEGFDAGAFMPAQPSPSPSNKRWPYAASYTLTGAAFDVNQTLFTQTAVGARVSNNSTHSIYTIPGNAVLGPSAMSAVSSPALKAHIFDSHQRHFPGVNLYFGYADCRQPILFFDGSVRVQSSSVAVTPWTPNSPSSQLPQQYQYAPQLWEPPTQNGQSGQIVQDRYRWTRSGLQGMDFQN